jgi:membrane-associated protein
MEFFKDIYQFLLDRNVQNLITNVGYIGMFIIIFSETGLLVGFFLPGDSLLVTAGLLAATPLPGSPGTHYFNILYLFLLLVPAALIGNTIGYYIGNKVGVKLFNKEQSFFFRKDYLIKTKNFYDKYGGVTIIIGQFMPIIRTFAAVVAGIAGLKYSRFIRYNFIGALTWIPSMLLIGYLLGNYIPGIDKHLEKVIIIIVLLSISPMIYKFIKSKLAKRKEHKNK